MSLDRLISTPMKAKQEKRLERQLQQPSYEGGDSAGSPFTAFSDCPTGCCQLSTPVAHADVALICELDEQWSFVGSKARQHWLWYAYNTKTGGVLAYTFGPRTDETCRELLALLAPFNTGMITRDDWGSYAREVPKEKHLTGKIFTKRIERNNLTLRTRIKRLARKKF